MLLTAIPMLLTAIPESTRYDEACSPRVRVRVSLGGTRPRLLAMALDILGAVVPGPAPDPNNSPRSAEGGPDRVLPPALNGKLPANAAHIFTTGNAVKNGLYSANCVTATIQLIVHASQRSNSSLLQ